MFNNKAMLVSRCVNRCVSRCVNHRCVSRCVMKNSKQWKFAHHIIAKKCFVTNVSLPVIYICVGYVMTQTNFSCLDQLQWWPGHWLTHSMTPSSHWWQFTLMTIYTFHTFTMWSLSQCDLVSHYIRLNHILEFNLMFCGHIIRWSKSASH